MARVAVDIDSTLYDFATPFREAFLGLAEEAGYVEEKKEDLFKGLYLPWLEWRSPVDAVGEDLFEEALEKVHNDEMILAQAPFPGSRETLRDLVGAGHDLLYVSNRASESLDATNQWLMLEGFPSGELQVVEQRSKAESVKDCQFIIDDRPRTLVEFVYDPVWYNEVHSAWEEDTWPWIYMQATGNPDLTADRIDAQIDDTWQKRLDEDGRKGFGLMYEYNRNLTDVRGVYLAPTWAGLRFYLHRRGVIPEETS